jgi:hypothetical protein
MTKEKIYLREIITEPRWNTKKLDIFSGDVEKDRRYLKKQFNQDARYFALKEIEEKKNERGNHKKKQR